MVNQFFIKPAVEQEIKFIVENCPDEVSGLGVVMQEGDKLTVVKQYLLEQTVGAAHTDIDATSEAALEFQVMQDFPEGMLCFWWHSHVNMSAFWSGTDSDTIKKRGNNGLCLASVYNKRGEKRNAIAYKVDSFLGSELVLNDNCQAIVIEQGLNESRKAELLAEITAKVKKQVYTPPASSFKFQYDSDYYNQGYYGEKDPSLFWQTKTDNEVKVKSVRKAVKEVRRALHSQEPITDQRYNELIAKAKIDGVQMSLAHEAAACGINPTTYELALTELSMQDLGIIDNKLTLFEQGAY